MATALSTRAAILAPAARPACPAVRRAVHRPTAAWPAGIRRQKCRRAATDPRAAIRPMATAAAVPAASPDSSRQWDGAIWAIAAPALLALTLDPVMSIVDTAIVGRMLGPVQQGGVGLASIVFTFSLATFNFLAVATTPLVAQALGRGDPDAASRTTAAGCFLALGIGAAVAAALTLGAPAAVGAMGSSPEVVPHALAYLRVRTLAAPALLLQMVCLGTFRGLGDTKTPLLVSVCSNVVNLTLVLCLVSTYGVRGTATATAAAQWFGALTNAGLLVRRGALRGVHLGQLPSWATAAPLLKAGGLLSIRMFGLLAAVGLATSFAARLGASALAAHEICRQCWLMTAMSLESLAIAGQVLVAQALGGGDVTTAKGVTRRLLSLAVCAGLCLGLVMYVAAPRVAPLFTSSPAVAAEVGRVLAIVAVAQPAIAVVAVMDGVLIGSRDNAYVALATTVASAMCWGGLLLSRSWGPGGLLGVWLALQLITYSRLATNGFRLRAKGLV